MKKYLILALGLTLLASTIEAERAEAYSSAVGVDPKNEEDPMNGHGNSGYGDYETKAIVKSATAGKSEALVRGLIVAYSSEADGYTVTRAVTRTVPGQRQLTCMTTDAVATGDTGYHACITRGFVRVKFDATSYPITVGVPACVDVSGVVTGCNTVAEATINTGIIPLESKASGTGDYLRAVLDLR